MNEYKNNDLEENESEIIDDNNGNELKSESNIDKRNKYMKIGVGATLGLTLFGGLVFGLGYQTNQENIAMAAENGQEYSYKLIQEEKAGEQLQTDIKTDNATYEELNKTMLTFINENKYTVDTTKVDGQTPYEVNVYYNELIATNFEGTVNALIKELDKIYTDSKGYKFNETEKKSYDAAKKEYDTLKATDLKTVTTSEDMMAHVNALKTNKTEVNKVISEHNARVQKENESKNKNNNTASANNSDTSNNSNNDGGEDTYYAAADISSSNGGTSSSNGSSSSSGSSSDSSSGSSNSTSGGGSSSSGGDESEDTSSSGQKCKNGTAYQQGWGVTCIEYYPSATASFLVSSEQDVADWINGFRAYVGLSSNIQIKEHESWEPNGSCGGVDGHADSAFCSPSLYLPPYDYIVANSGDFEALYDNTNPKYMDIEIIGTKIYVIMYH